MNFVNELVPEKDVEELHLNALWNRFNPRATVPHPGFTHSWTIDRSQSVFLMLVKIVEAIGRSGRNEPTNTRIFVLSWKGAEIIVTLDLAPESTKQYDQIPFVQTWELIEIQPTELPGVTREEIVQVLKQALTVYGIGSGRRQVPNTEVRFKF